MQVATRAIPHLIVLHVQLAMNLSYYWYVRECKGEATIILQVYCVLLHLECECAIISRAYLVWTGSRGYRRILCSQGTL